MKRQIIGWLKVIIPLALIVGLCRHAWRQHPDAVQTLRDGDTQFGLLAVGFLAILAAHVLGTIRWHLLLRALAIPIRLIDTLRLGFLGYLFNLISPGHVGGDLFKAVFIAREQRQQRTPAIATIVVDRVCGLFGLLLMSALALALSGVASISPTLAAMAGAVYLLTGIGGAAIVLMLTTPLATHPISQRLTQIPRVGPVIAQLLGAMQLYQRQRPVMVVVGLMSVSVHVLLALGVYFAARGVYTETPRLADHFVISPVASVAGALPITPGGLGSFELALSYMYDLLSPRHAGGRGIVVALLVRLAIICVAGIGVVFYWLNHRELQALLRQAEREAQQRDAEFAAEGPTAEDGAGSPSTARCTP